MSDETTGSLLPLQDFSTNKYKISESTGQCRFEAEKINYRLEDGKYFIMDEPVGAHQRVHRPSQESDLALVGAHQGMMKDNGTMSSFNLNVEAEAQAQVNSNNIKSQKDEAILNATNKLLTDLKKAYSQILNEKDLQLLHLRQEMADLKTLVSVLESENERLKQLMKIR
ncbi:MAG: hypothetical protein ACXVCP_00935 [Bdellovibrio sp.]